MRTKDESLFAVIVDYVNDYFEKYGRSPSTREIESGTQISRPTVQRYLKALHERGEIEYDGHRSIVTQYMREMVETNRVDMGNSIPCGPMDEVADAELEHIRLPIALTGSGEFFLLRARGVSMINAGIDDGDLVLIRKQETAREGQIVAFLYDSVATTLKRYEPSDESITLRPENDEMAPIVIHGDDRANLRIQGVATMVIKSLE
jgi:repressor LexA